MMYLDLLSKSGSEIGYRLFSPGPVPEFGQIVDSEWWIVKSS
jgi:hypothetical protein